MADPRAQESEYLSAFREAWEEGNRAWNEGDFERAYVALPDNFEYDLAATWPEGRRLQGREEVIAFFTNFRETFPDVRAEPNAELIEVDERTVIVGFEVIGTGGLSGARTTMQVWQVWEIAEGLRPVRLTEFPERSAAMEAARAEVRGARD